MNVFYSEHLLSNLVVLHKLRHICTVPRFRVVEKLQRPGKHVKVLSYPIPPDFRKFLDSFWSSLICSSGDSSM